MVIEEKRLLGALSILEKRIELFKCDCATYNDFPSTYALMKSSICLIEAMQNELCSLEHYYSFYSPKRMSKTFYSRFAKVVRYKAKDDFLFVLNSRCKLCRQLFDI